MSAKEKKQERAVFPIDTYVCMNIYIHICISCIYVSTSFLFNYIYTIIYCTYVYIYIYIYLYAYMYIHSYRCIHKCIYIDINMQITMNNKKHNRSFQTKQKQYIYIYVCTYSISDRACYTCWERFRTVAPATGLSLGTAAAKWCLPKKKEQAVFPIDLYIYVYIRMYIYIHVYIYI